MACSETSVYVIFRPTIVIKEDYNQNPINKKLPTLTTNDCKEQIKNNATKQLKTKLTRIKSRS
jgi:hypothetical protein